MLFGAHLHDLISKSQTQTDGAEINAVRNRWLPASSQINNDSEGNLGTDSRFSRWKQSRFSGTSSV